MDPIVIDRTTQDFDGKRYWLGGKYFMRHGKRLHRAVWEKAHGPIPKGSHIHHINEQRDDNRLANLECIPARAHKEHHGKANAARFVEVMTRLAVLTCTECGKEYTCTLSRATVSYACSGACRARVCRRKRKLDELH